VAPQSLNPASITASNPIIQPRPFIADASHALPLSIVAPQQKQV